MPASSPSLHNHFLGAFGWTCMLTHQSTSFRLLRHSPPPRHSQTRFTWIHLLIEGIRKEIGFYTGWFGELSVDFSHWSAFPYVVIHLCERILLVRLSGTYSSLLNGFYFILLYFSNLCGWVDGARFAWRPWLRLFTFEERLLGKPWLLLTQSTDLSLPGSHGLFTSISWCHSTRQHILPSQYRICRVLSCLSDVGCRSISSDNNKY